MGGIMGVTTGDTINSRHQHVVHNVRQMPVAAEITARIVINNFGNFEVVDGTFYLSSGCNFNTLNIKQNVL